MSKIMDREQAPDFFAKGGTTKMYGKGHAGEAPAGISGKESQESDAGMEGPKNRKGDLAGYGKGFTFQAGGGSNEMFGKGHAGKKVPGISGKATQEG